ncbi:MAG: hypothetical protein ACYTG1_06445 [Planctomycetota bacterium]|jgi:hypothetical protein
MSEQVITLRAADGATAPAQAEVVRHGSGRVVRAIAFVLAGLVGGTVCIIVPVLHLITTWALPLAGIVLCVRTLRTRVVIGPLTGACPACHAPLDLPGGSADDAGWQACGACGARLELVLPDPGTGKGDEPDARQETTP